MMLSTASGTGPLFRRSSRDTISFDRPFEPCFLPKDQAGRFASAVSCSVTPDLLEMYAVRYAANAPTHDVLTRLIRTLGHSNLFTAESKHLRHKREIFQAAVLVKRGEDFLPAAYLNPFASFKVQTCSCFDIVA